MRSRTYILTAFLAGIVLAIGLLVIVGWLTDSNTLKTFVQGNITMKFNTALGIILCSLVLLVPLLPVSEKAQKVLSNSLSIAVLLLGLLSLSEYVFSLHLGIDNFFVHDPQAAHGGYVPGRMSVITAINFTLLGTGLLLMNRKWSVRYHLVYLPAVAFISFCMLIGFNMIDDVPDYIRISVPVALAFICLCIAIFWAQPMLLATTNFERNLFMALTAAVVLIATISVLSLYYSNKRISSNNKITRANMILRQVEEVVTVTKDFESGSRGYVLTGDSVYLENSDTTRDDLAGHLLRLRSYTVPGSVEQQRVDLLAKLVEKRINFSLKTIELRNREGENKAAQLISTREGKNYMDEIRHLVNDIENAEREVLYKGQAENEKSIISFNRTFLFFLASVFILLTIIIFTLRQSMIIRRKADAELRESETVFSTLFYKSPIMKLLTESGTGKILDANDAFAEFMGHTRQELIGTNRKEMNMVLDEERINEISAVLRAQGFIRDAEGQVRSKDGKLCWVSTNIDTMKLYGKDCYLTAMVDITQRKEIEERLKKFNQELEQRVIERTAEIQRSELRYRYLFANNPMPMWVIEEGTYKYLDVNDRAIEVYGYSREEFLRMTATDIRPASEKNKFLNLNRQEFEEPWNYFRGTWTHIKKDGTPIQVQVFAHKVEFENIKARLILCNDVTEQKQAEEKLAASEERFRSLIENSEEGISMMDASLKIIYRSPSSERIVDYAADNDMINVIHPDDRESVMNSIETSKQNPGIPIAFTGRYKHQDGHYFWLEGTLNNQLHIPGINAIVSNYRDVTQRKESERQLRASEEQFRTTLDNMLEGAQIIDFDWRYVYVNDAFTRHARYTREELLGHTVMEKYPGIEQHPIFNVYKRCFEKRESIHLENEFVFPDGTPGWFELSFQPVPQGIFILSVDITQRKQAEAEIKRINAELEQRVIERTAELKRINDELEAFSYSVSHDLRAPLRGIIGFASILEEDHGKKLNAEGIRVLNVIKQNTSKMGQLIDDLLTFSRMGRSQFSKTKIDSNTLVAEVVIALQTQQPANIDWQIGQLPAVEGDLSMMRQVWVNLISNAIKYSRNSVPPRIEIGANKEGKRQVFYIKDNGVGFDAQYKDKLFKVFQRLHSGHEFEGTGVGLAIVEKIIARHGGQVWVHAEINKGATFYFSLPAI